MILISAAIVLAVIGLLPLLVMLLRSVTVDGHLSLVAYQDLLASRRQWVLLKHSFVLSSLTALLVTVIGSSLGILLAKTDLPFRRTFAVLFTIPLLIPPYIVAISWSIILGREGLLARVLGHSEAEVTSDWFFGLPGCVLVLFSTFLPIAMLLTMTFLKTINPRLEEAGKIVSGWMGVLKGITFPMILPGVLLASILVFLLTLGEFGVPAFLRYDVFPVETFTQFSAFYNFGAATAAAIPLAVITFLVLLVERIFLREKTYEVRLASGSEENTVICLGRARKWCITLVTVLLLLVVVVPLLVLVLRSMSFGAYSQAISRSGNSLLRSLTYLSITKFLFSGKA
jgi:iron(III) transport system permease protein